MISAEELLEGAAKDGSLESNEWPRVLETVLSRLDSITHNDFPIPSTPVARPVQQPSEPNPKLLEPSSQESQSADKENAPPSGPGHSTRPSEPTDDALNPPAPTSSPPTLPSELLALHNSIRTALTTNFPSDPPHTIQRLAELVLRPRAHYRFLPSYLHALDRVISVSSPATVFPLPQAVLPGTVLPNGTGAGDDTSSSPTGSSAAPSPFSSASLGSDESLGGALLTPIPWLRPDRDRDRDADRQRQNELRSESTEMVDGPNGAGRIETVSVVNGGLVVTHSTTTAAAAAGAGNNANAAPSSETALREAGSVTQGELLRQEQEAGVVPITIAAAAAGSRSVTERVMQGSGNVSGVVEGGDAAEGADAGEMQVEEEKPHARGPETIGMEDMGPQGKPRGGGLDLEAAVGRAGERREERDAAAKGDEEGVSGTGDVDGAVETGTKEGAGSADADGDGDVVIADADADGETTENQGLGENDTKGV